MNPSPSAPPGVGAPESPLVRALPFAVLVLGLALGLGPMWSSKLALVPGDSQDARLVHFSLEHGHRFLLQQAPHGNLWNPPLFYPARNVAAYTDTLLGFVPFYSPWRLLGADPNLAFQLWLVTVLGLTFGAGYWVLRRLFGLGVAAACAGAYCFGFAGPRMVMVLHPQLLPWFFWALALLALGLLVPESQREGLTRRERKVWIFVLPAALAAQAWGAFYPAFFFVFLVGMGGALALLTRDGRRSIRGLLAAEGPTLALAAGVGAILVAPLAQRYLLTADLVGTRGLQEVVGLLPRPLSWLMPHGASRFLGDVWQLPFVKGSPQLFGRPHISQGLGILTPALALLGLWAHRRRRAVQLLAGVTALLFLLTILWPGGSTLWSLVHATVPGATAIRAVSRFGLCLLIPAALGVALLFDRSWVRRRPLLGLALFAGIVAEQAVVLPAHYQQVYDLRVEALAEAVGPECDAFVVILNGHRRPLAAFEENAMWAAMASGVPTLNGRYGNSPPAWRLALKHHPPGAKGRYLTFDTELRRWLDYHCIDPSSVCRLLVDHTGLEVTPAPWHDLEARPTCAR
ncbi:MAG: hypothetical protein AAGD06_12140 [Acidobacteriota bacterium]